jgi:SAM-dependent methyltransferase
LPEKLFKTFNERVRGKKKGDPPRWYMFRLIFDQIIKEGLSGDVAELGVYRGHTAALLTHIAHRIGGTAYLLDTFDGFSKDDLVGVDDDKPMQFDDVSLAAVQAVVGVDSIRLIKGYFPDSANQMPDDASFCLVHIDCDLYLPCHAALSYFYSRLVPGGFLVVHDYSSLHWQGVENAVDTFFADKPEFVIPIPDKGGTAVIRKV